jgi:hypothetical protein
MHLSRVPPILALLGIAVLAFATSASAGDSIRGSGKLATSTRSVGAFRAVEVNGPIDLELRVGSPQRVEIIADHNLVGLITTTIRDRSLVIDTGDRPFRTRNPVRAVLVAPSLDALVLRGSGTARVDGVSTRAFELSIRGEGDARLTGTASRVVVRVAGSADVDATNLAAESAAVDVKGSGGVSVRASKVVAANVSGSGGVTIFGNPKNVVRNVRGSGTIDVKN